MAEWVHRLASGVVLGYGALAGLGCGGKVASDHAGSDGLGGGAGASAPLPFALDDRIITGPDANL